VAGFITGVLEEVRGMAGGVEAVGGARGAGGPRHPRSPPLGRA
jgi:hypothetical protein